MPAAARVSCSTAPARWSPTCSARPDEIAFCASGTQAAHLAVLGGLNGRRRTTTEADVDRFLAVLPGIVAELRQGLEGL